MQCRVCKKEHRPVYNVSFVYDGLMFFINSAEMKCFECMKKGTIERYEHCRGLASIVDGKLVIDWNFYKNVYYLVGASFEVGQMISILMSLGVLVASSEGWTIIVPGVFRFTPRLVDFHVNFSEERFAREYAEVMLTGTVVSWEVVEVL